MVSLSAEILHGLAVGEHGCHPPGWRLSNVGSFARGSNGPVSSILKQEWSGTTLLAADKFLLLIYRKHWHVSHTKLGAWQVVLEIVTHCQCLSWKNSAVLFVHRFGLGSPETEPGTCPIGPTNNAEEEGAGARAREGVKITHTHTHKSHITQEDLKK